MKKIFIWVFLFLFGISTSFAFLDSQVKSANSLAQKWVINDHSNDISKYNLDSKVLRQEIAAIARGVAWVKKEEKCKNIFKDLTAIKPNSWACINVEPLVENNLIAKNDFFRPEDPITKTETLWMLIKSIWFDYSYNPKNPKNWQEQIIDFAVSKWIVKKFTDYNAFATRGWVFDVADYSMKLRKKEIEKLKNTKKYSDEASINDQYGVNIDDFFNF